MPKAFEDCIKSGGKVRTKDLGKDRFVHICIPKGGGPSISGEVKTKQMTPKGGPEGRIYKRK
jgi:hypothetical protein